MSEPMSAVEIEDVLSSIRKLVSDELRPLARDPAPDKGDGGAERLILTPALRVVAPPPGAAPSVRDEVSQTIGRLADAIGAAQPFESETGDPAPDSVLAQAALAPDEDRAVLGLHVSMAEEALFAEIEDDDVAAPWDGAGLASGEGDLLVFRSRQHDGATRMPAEVEPAAALVTEKGAGESSAEESDAEAFARVVAEVLVGGAGEGAPRIAPDADFPDEEEAVDFAADQAWADEAEAALLAELDRELDKLDVVADPIAPGADPASVPPAGAIAAIDPGELREIVRQMIREELQGSLGERITRNVRKLVRAEIARALTLHDLD